jgi:hypothetical protein
MDKKIKLALSMDQIIQQINAEAELLGFLKVKPTGSHVKKVNKKSHRIFFVEIFDLLSL